VKKLIIIIALICATPSYAIELWRDSKNLGGVVSCTIDSDVDTAFATTVAVDAAAGQKVIGLTAVTNLAADDTILIDANNSGLRREVCVVASIATLDVTCDDNLEFAHTAAQADDVVLTNRLGPFGVGNSYVIQLVSAVNGLISGSWVMGDKYANAESSMGVTVSASIGATGDVAKIPRGGEYISFVSETASSVAKVCLIR